MRPIDAVLLALLLTAGAPHEDYAMFDESTHVESLFEFNDGDEPWTHIDDAVMGGVSRSRMTIANGVAVFEGVVSLENNGGFASVLSAPGDYDLSAYDGLDMRVCGDGKTYSLRLRTARTLDGVSYQATFVAPDNEWGEIRLPFSAFKPSYRGRILPDEPPLDPARVKTFGLMIADKQEGEFRLEIDAIRAYANRRALT